jgi:hypothetical protein
MGGSRDEAVSTEKFLDREINQKALAESIL